MQRPLVGIAVIVRKGDEVLLHKRIGSHAGNTYAFAGGHLEMFETFEEAGLRELQEEAGDMQVTQPRYWTTENTRFPDEDAHYVCVFMICDWVCGEPFTMEPEKNEGWDWYNWDDLPQPLITGTHMIHKRGMNPITVDYESLHHSYLTSDASSGIPSMKSPMIHNG